MKIKYRYRSDWFALFLYSNLAIMFALIVSGWRVYSEVTLFIILGLGATVIIVSIMLDYSPATIIADDSSVWIRKRIENTVINYSDIKDIQITQEHRKPQIRGDQAHYVEIMTIYLNDGSIYELKKKLDIDYNALITNPEKLKNAFDDSQFNRLRSCIYSNLQQNEYQGGKIKCPR